MASISPASRFARARLPRPAQKRLIRSWQPSRPAGWCPSMLPRRARRAPAAFHRSVAAWSLFRLALASSLHGFHTCVAQLLAHLLPRLKGLKERDGESPSVTRNSGARCGVRCRNGRALAPHDRLCCPTPWWHGPRPATGNPRPDEEVQAAAGGPCHSMTHSAVPSPGDMTRSVTGNPRPDNDAGSVAGGRCHSMTRSAVPSPGDIDALCHWQPEAGRPCGIRSGRALPQHDALCCAIPR